MIDRTDIEIVLLRMYRRRFKLFEYLGLHSRKHGRYVSAGKMVAQTVFDALRIRRLIEQTRNDSRGKITWSLTDKGRALAKELLA